MRVGRGRGDGRDAGRGEQPLLISPVLLPDPPGLIMEEIVKLAGRRYSYHGGRVEDGVPQVAGRGRERWRTGHGYGRKGRWCGDGQNTGRGEQLMITLLVPPPYPRI